MTTTVDRVRRRGLCKVRAVAVPERADTSPTSVFCSCASNDQLIEQTVTVRLAALTKGLAVQMVLDHGRMRSHYVSASLKASTIEPRCDESALQQAAARVPVPVISQPSNAEGAE
jgi:hypothetical protein